MFYLVTAAIVIGGFLCSVASAQKIKSVHSAAGTDFSKYKTYKWKRADDAVYPKPETDQMLIRTIEAELAKKGLTKTDGAADVYVIYQIAVFQTMEWSSFSTELGWPGGYNSFGTFVGSTTNSSTPIQVGSLIIDFYDVATKKQVWQVHATKTLDANADAKKQEKNAQKAMSKVFKNYPPPAK